MEQSGQFVPSNSHIYINFRTANNESKIPQEIMNKPKIFRTNFKKNNIIEHEILTGKGMPFILLKTNLCERPLKLFIDTGATISIISDDVIENEINKQNYIINVLGLNDKNNTITTQGIIHSIFFMNDVLLGTNLHIVDRKYLKSGDGYLGLDFLVLYKINIDLNKKCLIINMNGIMNDNIYDEPRKGHLNENTEENILNNFTQTNDFETNLPMISQKKRKNKKNLRQSEPNKCHKNKDNIKFNQNKCRKNEEINLNTCPTSLSTSPNKFPKVKTLNEKFKLNDDVQGLTNFSLAPNILNAQLSLNERNINQYQISHTRRKISRNKILNDNEHTTEESQLFQYSPSISTKTHGLNEEFNTCNSKSNKIIKNLTSTTLDDKFFKDYG